MKNIAVVSYQLKTSEVVRPSNAYDSSTIITVILDSLQSLFTIQNGHLPLSTTPKGTAIIYINIPL
jgi:hypothetical protein